MSRQSLGMPLTASIDGAAKTVYERGKALYFERQGQFNLAFTGVNAEPEDSGQRAAYVSPGISWTVGKDAQMYAYVQVPVYQSVNGVQLTADWSSPAGVSLRF